MVRIGGYARTLGVREIYVKNTIFQSFRPPCSFSVSDMEPSMSLYRKMSRKEYVQVLHERLEPVSACDLIYTQFKERTQKAGEVYEDKITAFGRFRKYQSQTGYKAKEIKRFTVPGRQPAEDDICYNCNSKGHVSRNCPRNNLPGRYQNVNKVEKSSPDTSDDILKEQDTSSSDTDLELDYVKEKKKPKPSHVKSKKKRRNIYQIVEEQGEQINSISAKLSEICNLSSQLSEMMSTVSRRKGEVNTLGETSVFPSDIEDINRECNDNVFVFFIGSLLCCNELNENPEKYAFLGYIRAMKSGSRVFIKN